MVRNTNTQRAILDLAESMLQDKGFNGFSYAHIAAKLGVKNAAIHYHFPSKEELGCAVIQRYRDRFKLWVNNARVKELSPEKNSIGSLGSTPTCARITARYAWRDRLKLISIPSPIRCASKPRH